MADVERTVMFQLPTVIAGQLVCVEGTVAGSSYDLTAGTFVIGRRDGADLHLPDEPGVSKMHAKILAEGERYTIVDAESRNGTVVNGAPVQRHILKDGDEIRICSCVLRFSQSGDIDVKNPVEAYQEQLAPPDTTIPDLPPPNATAQVIKTPVATERVAAQVPEKKKGLFIPFVTGFMTFLLLGAAAMIVVVMLADDEASTIAGTIPSETPSDPKAKNPEGTEPMGTKPEGTQPEGTNPEGTKPEGTKPEGTKPEGTNLAGTNPEGTDPTGTKPEGTKPEGTKPEGTKPEGTNPEGTKPEETNPADTKDSPATFVDIIRTGRAPIAVRPRAGGRLQSYSVAVGDSVQASAPLFITNEPADRNAIATLRESISALAEVAESQPEAAEFLASEKAKLRALEKRTRVVKTIAPVAGKVISLNVNRGVRVSTKSPVLTLQPKGEIMKVSFSQEVKKGAPLTIQYQDGTKGTGKVLSVEKKASLYVATIEAARKTSPAVKAALK